MSYEERYGERMLSDNEQAELEDRIETLETLDKLERCVNAIKDLLNTPRETREDLEEILNEIEYEIGRIKE